MTKPPRIDPLVAEIGRVLSPVLATARERAELLVDHLDQPHGRFAGWRPRGLGDAVRKLRQELPDEDILAGAHSLLIELTNRHGDRETVV